MGYCNGPNNSSSGFLTLVGLRIPIPGGMEQRCHIAIVSTLPFWFSRTVSQTILRLGLKLCEYLSNENVYTVYFLSPLITTDFRILDGIPKVVNAIIAFNNNNKKQTFGPFQRRRTYRVETRGQDAILSY